MKKTLILFLLIPLYSPLFGQDDFSAWFGPGTLRLDYQLAGDDQHTDVFFQDLKREPYWGGSHTQLVDTFRYGEFMLELNDQESGKLIYSRGFSTLFSEWQTTAESRKIRRSFYQVALMPFPLKPVTINLFKRNRKGLFERIYEMKVDPSNYFIRDEKLPPCKTNKVHDAGDPADHLDVVFLAEGYTLDEMGKFREDVERMTQTLLSTPPYDHLQDRINIWSVESPSLESGTDIPGERIYRNTVMNAGDYTFDLPRYITTFDLKSIHDYAACVPADQVVVLVNSNRYGGGGIYNHYASVTADHPLSQVVFVHEFGHSFAGLGDEYYTSEVAYEDFYPLDVEPWEPNLTTRVDFGRKWENMIDPGTPVPTPNDPAYAGITGLFEGGGYVAKGVYRPALDCRMKSNEADSFCAVCQRAIERMILFYSE